MQADSYFETDPWTEITNSVRSGALGPIAAIAVQVTCVPGALDADVQAWQARFEALLGAPNRQDIRRVASAVSLLARYQGDTIARLFADEGAGGPVCNIEIVGRKGLLLWKPDVHPLSRLSLSGRDETIFAHPYATDLAKEAAP